MIGPKQKPINKALVLGRSLWQGQRQSLYFVVSDHSPTLRYAEEKEREKP